MFSDPGIHYTNTKHINKPHGFGWEFTCPECSYHAQYCKQADLQDYRLEIMDPGAAHARHVSYQVDPTIGSEWLKVSSRQNDEAEEQTWLPLHLERQIEEILKKFDVNKGLSGHH